MMAHSRGRSGSRAQTIAAAVLGLALLHPASARADGTCKLLPPQNSDRVSVVDVGSNGGVCSVDLPNGDRVQSTVDDTAEICTITKIGGNITIVWPRGSAGTSCADTGPIGVIIIWPA